MHAQVEIRMSVNPRPHHETICITADVGIYIHTYTYVGLHMELLLHDITYMHAAPISMISLSKAITLSLSPCV